MATHDYVIDNSTGANVRSDINNVLQAILTNNSSSSAPSTTAAYMWWADTTTGILKIRNSANDGWVELLQLDGTLTLEDGSASTPALAFRDDLNTGIFSAAADEFNIATGGVERVTLSSGATVFNQGGSDTDFRIESDSVTHMFFIDSGNNRIGIGTSTPDRIIHCHNSSTTTNVRTKFSNGTTGEGASDGFEIGINASNPAEAVLVNNENSPMAFFTNATERMRIDSSGRFLFGHTSNATGSLFQINSGANFFAASNDANGAVVDLMKTRSTTPSGNTILQDGDKIGELRFRGNTGAGYVAAATIQAIVNGTPGSGNDLPTDLVFRVQPDGSGNTFEPMRITSSGILLVGKASTSQTYTLQVQSDSNANGIAIYGRSADDIAEIGWYENDGTTKLGELQYRQDHVAFRHRVGHIEFATTFSGNSLSERMRVFEDKLCIGTTAGVGLATSRRLQIRGTNHANVGMNILITANDSNPASIDLGKSRSSGNAILGNNDDVGQINFYGNDGSGFHSMARILCRCQGHDTSNDDLPAALVFSTLTENTTALKERLIIDDEGIITTCSQNHALGVSTTASSGTNKYNFRGHHSGTNGQPGSGTLSFTVWSNGNVENLNNSYGSTSDIKLKENIVDANSQWNDIKAIKIRNYNFKEETGQSTKTQIGLVAQELETVCPKLIYETPDFDDKGEDLGTTTKCISYSVLYIKAIKALQESMAKIEVLETKVAALEAA